MDVRETAELIVRGVLPLDTCALSTTEAWLDVDATHCYLQYTLDLVHGKVPKTAFASSPVPGTNPFSDLPLGPDRAFTPTAWTMHKQYVVVAGTPGGLAHHHHDLRCYTVDDHTLVWTRSCPDRYGPVTAVAMDDTHVYVATVRTGRLCDAAFPRKCGTVHVIPFGAAFDDDNVYHLGGATEGPKYMDPRALAVDATHVYVATDPFPREGVPRGDLLVFEKYHLRPCHRLRTPAYVLHVSRPLDALEVPWALAVDATRVYLLGRFYNRTRHAWYSAVHVCTKRTDDKTSRYVGTLGGTYVNRYGHVLHGGFHKDACDVAVDPNVDGYVYVSSRHGSLLRFLKPRTAPC